MKDIIKETARNAVSFKRNGPYIILIKKEFSMNIFLDFFGFLTTPVWCIVLCLNFIAILQKIRLNEDYTKNTFWFTLSFTFLVCILFYLISAY